MTDDINNVNIPIMSNEIIGQTGIYEQPVGPYTDQSRTIYFSDGTVSTAQREERVQHLLNARHRNLTVDPESAAGWFNALARPYATTPQEVAVGLDLALSEIEDQIRVNMPTTRES